MRQVSDLLIFGGVAAILVGLAARYGLVSWFGNLPGDIRRVGERSVGLHTRNVDDRGERSPHHHRQLTWKVLPQLSGWRLAAGGWRRITTSDYKQVLIQYVIHN